MTRRLSFWTVWLVALAVCLPTAAQAAEAVHRVIPDDVLGFAVVRNLDQTNKKLDKLIIKFGAPVRNLLKTAKAAAGVKEGVNDRGAAAVTVYVNEGRPTPVIFIPTTDHKKLIAQLNPGAEDDGVVEIEVAGERMLATNKGDFTLFAPPNGAEVLKKVRASTKAVKLAKGMDDWLGKQDAYAVFTERGIKLGANQALEGLRQVKEFLGGEGPELEAAMAVFGMYEKMLEAVRDGVSQMAVAVRVDDSDAIHLASRTVTKFDAGKTVASSKPLAGLPAGPFVLAGGGSLPRSWNKAFANFGAEMMKAMARSSGDVDDADAKRLAELTMRSYESINGMSMCLGVGQTDDSLYENMVFKIDVADADRFLDTYEDTIREMNKLNEKIESPFLGKMESKRVKIRGRSALEMKIEMSAEQLAPFGPEAERLMKVIVGSGDKLTAYVGAANKKTIVGAYISKDQYLRAVDLVVKGGAGLAGDDNVAKTKAQLPKGAQLVGYWSPKGTVDLINRLIPVVQPDETFRLPEFADSPPVGFALKIEGRAIESDLVIPAGLVDGISDYVKKIQSLFAVSAEAVGAR